MFHLRRHGYLYAMVEKQTATRGVVVAACSLGALALPFLVSQTSPGHTLRAIIHPDEPQLPAAVPTPPTDSPIVVTDAGTTPATDGSTTSASTGTTPTSQTAAGTTAGTTAGTGGPPPPPRAAPPGPKPPPKCKKEPP